LVATFNARGTGRTGGRGGSATTEVADYESVVKKLLSLAEEANCPVEKLYLCVYPPPERTNRRDTVRTLLESTDH
jgi:hypothetical protein